MKENQRVEIDVVFEEGFKLKHVPLNQRSKALMGYQNWSCHHGACTNKSAQGPLCTCYSCKLGVFAGFLTAEGDVSLTPAWPWDSFSD